MKKIFTLTIILALLGFTIGCFDVERNNPFDPDADLPDSEKMVTVKGYTYRGYSDQILPDVEVTIGGKTTVSDSGGYYSIDIMPGTHSLRASKDGWSKMNYQINVKPTANAIATQHEDISMFIWWEYWEAYNPMDEPGSPWNNDSYGTGYTWINNNYVLELGVIDSGDPANSCYTVLFSWPNQNTIINNVLIGLRFSNTWYGGTHQGFRFEDDMGTQVVSVYFCWASLTTYSTVTGYYYVEDDTNKITERDIFVEFRVNPNNRKEGMIYFYNQNGTAIFTQSNVELNEDFNPGMLVFEIFNESGDPKVEGTMQVLFVEFF